MTPSENLPSGPLSPAGPPSALQIRQQAYSLRASTASPEADEEADAPMSIKDAFQLLYKYKWVLLAAMLLCTAAALVRGLTSPLVYQASVLIQIDKPAARIVQFNRDVDPQQEEDYLMMQTQIELLRSRSLAERVIDELQLDPTRASGRVAGVAPGALVAGAEPASSKPAAAAGAGLLDRVVAGYRNLGKPSVNDKEILGREAALGRLLGSVAIEPVKNSRLIKINVTGTDASQTARVANGYAKTYVANTTERRMQSSVYAKTFLEEQLKVTKEKLEASDRALNTYAKNNSLLTLDEKTNVINQTYTDYSSALSKVEQDRLKAEAQYNAVAASPESATQVLENKTVQNYKEQRAKLEAEYLNNLTIYKPEFPRMLQIKAQITELEARIKGEVAAVLVSMKSQLDAAKKQEDQVRARLQDTRKEVLQAQDKSVDLNLLKRELDTNRQLYDGLLQRLKEVGVTSSLVTNNVSIVDEATVPLFPISPNLMKNAGVGLLAGLLLGLGFAFMREHFDDTIRRVEEIEAKFGLPLLGIIPFVKKKPSNANSLPLMALDDPRGVFAESYRSMRTALQFSTAEGAPRRCMVTSSVQAEGKSTTALSLAITFSQMGQRVLLIDADMRNPSLHKSLSRSNDTGLSTYLSGASQLEPVMQNTSITHLALLTAGPHPPSPVDLLMGPRLLELLERAEAMGFDKIVIDAPPVLGIADAIVLGNQVQNILFVVKAGSTRISNIRDALRRLRTGGLLPLGVVLTSTEPTQSSYYDYGPGYLQTAAESADRRLARAGAAGASKTAPEA